MRRIGLLVAILSLLLLVGLGLLVTRALDSVERERAMRHEVLAERVFDELEEQLTELTEREEARPFLQYRFFYVPEGQVTGNPALSRSPLSLLPDTDWLLGWYQLDPDGGISTPFEPDDDALADTIGWSESVALTTRVARLREVAAKTPAQAEDRRSPNVSDEGGRVADVSTREPVREKKQEPAPTTKQPAKQPAEASDADDGKDGVVAVDATTGSAAKSKKRSLDQSSDPYGIGSLNKGATRRGERQQRVTKSSAENVRSYQFPEDNTALLGAEADLPEVAFEAPTDDAVAEVVDGWSPGDAVADAAEEILNEEEEEALADKGDEFAPQQTRQSRRKRSVPAPVVMGRKNSDRPATTETAQLAQAVEQKVDPKPEAEPEPEPQQPPEPQQAATVAAPKVQAAVTASRYRPRTPAPPPPPPEDGEVDVEISPFRGHRVDDETMLLFRTVRIGEVVYVQGLALLLPKLAQWLESRVLDGSEVQGFVDLAWNGSPRENTRTAPPADFTFAHTFAEPFTALGVTSYVDALPEPRGSGRAWILQLTAMLVLVGLLGLVALWRMISVVVHFAERRSNFVAAVSHELKTPLTAIRMYSEMLRDGYVLSEEKREEYYGTMAAESERLSRLIQNVLELSNLEQGVRGGEIVVGDVRPVLEEAIRVLERHARDRGFTVVLDTPDDLPAVRYERDGLLQVLINLVDNGIKFSKDADPREVVIQVIPRSGGLTLQVRDHGPGVPQRQLGRIFQPFYRGERELTRRTKGTGIGLALVKGIVDRMGGQVSARNHPDGGFEVRVALVL